MQDGAGGHRAKATIEELNGCGISHIQWPLLSPDLNPIEAI
jgi:transposase